MRNFIIFFAWSFLIFPFNAKGADIIKGAAAARLVPGAEMVRISDKSAIPNFVRFQAGQRPDAANLPETLHQLLRLNAHDGFELISSTRDQLGMTHLRFRQTYQGFPVVASMWNVHLKDGKVISMNGDYFTGINSPCIGGISESAALIKALDHMGAQTYKWELPSEERFLKWEQEDPAASFFPKGEFTLAPLNGNFHHPSFSFAYKFDIYAHQPLARKLVYVHARTGEIIWEQDLIHHIDSAGTASTGYSGVVPIISDFTGSIYRLRESGRGNGIETYDMNEGTSYGAAVDFTDLDNFWNNANGNLDQYAGDAHWGAEMTYDYFLQEHGRNSIDGNGFRLRSYIHYDQNYSNAFWDGSRMTYGDGNNRPFTAIDIAGHEISHGLTTNSANLVYQNESGALNESFSDIFGNTVERYGRPLQWNWRIGEDLFSGGFRNMQNPPNFNDPDTYLGTHWYTGTGDNGGVHTNSGVQNKWYYILTSGESGTNDNGDPYSVSGIGIDKAGEIAFRNLTVYLTPSSEYADARFYAIESALDLFGPCSNEVVQTTNAWYAVGIGNEFNPTGSADFLANATTTCTGTVFFSDQSTSSALSWDWDFGDGQGDTIQNPSHTYAANGTYSVTLIITDCQGQDTVIKSSYITVARPNGPAVSSAGRCGPGSVTLSASGAGTLKWYDAPSGGNLLTTGNSFTTPNLSQSATYYVESQVAQPSSYVGPANNTSVGTGGYHNNSSTQFLNFTVYAPVTLKSAWVNAPSSGNRTIRLWDGTGNALWDTTINISSGTGRVTLNKFLAPGSYRIGGTQMNLYRNNSGPNYPYVLSGKVEITGSSAGPNYYYYLYDWELTEDPCTSLRTPVTANINFASGQVTPSGPTTVCVGSSVTLTADPNAMYSWSNGDSTQAVTITSSGSYTVTVTDSNGCTAISSPIAVNVTNNPQPVITTAGNTALCPGDTSYLSASQGSAYLWSNGATTPTIPVTTAGSYTVTVTYPGGCTGISSATGISINTPPSAGINSSLGNTICNNASTTLTGTGGVSYNWSTGSTANSIQVNSQGTYTVTATDANGCTDVETINISTIPAPVASISTPSTTICDGDLATLTATGGTTYLWSTGATTASIDVGQSGIYTVTATSANGCEDAESISISVINPPSASYTYTSNLMTISFSNTSTGTTGFCTYAWDFGDGTNSGAQFPTHTYPTPGTYTVSLVVDCQGCRDTAMQTIVVLETGVTEALEENSLAVYPNPFSNQLNFQVFLPRERKMEISLVDVMGRSVIPVFMGTAHEGEFNFSWEVPGNLANGIYHVRFYSEGQVFTKKVILQR